MPSHILGKLDLDAQKITDDLAELHSFPRIEEAYDEFSSGYWKNCSLWNSSGDLADTTYRDLKGELHHTEYAKRLPYLERLVTDTFDMSHVTMVRARNLIDAMVIPHRDFVELEKSPEHYFRIFMVLEDNPAAFHSDETSVFHMRPGEIWFLDAASVHAAVNFSTLSRQSVCVDFAFDGEFAEGAIFRQQSTYRPDIVPELADRKPLAEDFGDQLRHLGRVVNHDNFKDIVFLLSKVHFRSAAPITETYRWLQRVCDASGDPELVAKAAALRVYMTESRGMDERFTLSADH